MGAIKVLIGDDEGLYRDMLLGVLSPEDRVDVAGAARNGTEAIRPAVSEVFALAQRRVARQGWTPEVNKPAVRFIHQTDTLGIHAVVTPPGGVRQTTNLTQREKKKAKRSCGAS